MQPAVVVQEETSGCGIACVAMLAGVTYAEAKHTANRLKIFAEDEKLWSETGYVRRLLDEYGVTAAPEEVLFSGWEKLPDLALLAIKHHIDNGRPSWHWVVFSRQAGTPVVFDPAADLANNCRTDFKQMPPKWSIEIET